MNITGTPDELQLFATTISDVMAAFSARLSDLPKDQAVILDGLTIAAMFDPTLAPIVVLEPIAFAFVVAFVANNLSGRPGSQTPMHGSGSRGNTGSGGGRI